MGEDKIGKITPPSIGSMEMRVLETFLLGMALCLICLPSVDAFSGKVCGSTSPCNCGSNCSGGNELYGQTQAYCDSNPIECFNTIDNCRDGSINTLNYVKDINITALNGSVFRIGDVIQIDATLFSSSANSEGVFFVYSNATINASVNWSVIYSTTFGVADSNYHVRFNYTLHKVLGEHTIRVIDEFSQSTNITCGRDVLADFPAYSDTDDITFSVLPQPAPSINFSGPTPSNSTSVTSVTAIINVTHNETHPDKLTLYWNGTNESYSYSGGHTAIIKSNLQPGNYSFYVWVNDTFGNTNQTETRIVSISTPIAISIGHPNTNAQFRNSTIPLNTTVQPIDGLNLTNVTYQLNNNANVSILAKKLNVSIDTSDVDGLRNESALTHHNLSQSFIPNQVMSINNISIKLKRVGFPNATLQIRTDSNGNPSQTTLFNISINNASVSTSSFEWISFGINGTVSLENGTRYWLFLGGNGSTTDHYSWEANNDSAYSQGSFLNNNSVDLLFRIFDAYRFRTQITAPDGSNNVTIFAQNSNGTIVSSSNIQFIVDTAAPSYSGEGIGDDPIQSGQGQLFEIAVTDAVSTISKVLLEFNNSNYTMTLAFGSTYNLSVAAGYVGSHGYRFYTNDSLGNMVASALGSFDVEDTVGPGFSNIANNPSNDAGLDPGAPINVSVLISDSGGLSSALLQYRNSSLNWTNVSMSNTSSLYWGNFTPPTQGVWQYQIWANDTSANTNTSETTSLNITLDFNWTATPSGFSAVSGILGRNVSLGNITINNTADNVLGFSLSSDRSFVYFNTSSFALAAGEVGVIRVNATTPLDAATYSIINTIDATNASALPDSLTNNATLVAITQGPYLFIEIVQFNASFLKPAFIDLRAKITNIGNETAYNVSANWSVPSDWTTIPAELNISFSNITVNGFVYHNISADIGADASSGSKTITVNAQSPSGGNNSESETITVLSSGSVESSDSSSSGGGGASSSSSGSGGGFALPIKQKVNISIASLRSIELVAPQNITFSINITNEMQNKILRDVKIATEGFLKSKVSISPVSFKNIEPLTTKNVSISLEIPEYMKQQNLSLHIIVSGIAYGKLNNSGQGDPFEEDTVVSLIILEITKEVAKEALMRAWDALAKIDRISEAKRLEGLLSQAEDAFVKGDLVLAKALADEIVSESELAADVFSLMAGMNERLEEAAARGEDVSELQPLLALAQELFFQEKFSKAKEVLDQAALAERLHVERLESGFWFALTSFLWAYWWTIGLITLAVGGTIVLLQREFSLDALQKKVQSLGTKEENILELLKKTQQHYFKEKIMSSRMYQKTMEQYTMELARVNEDRISLKGRIIVKLKMARNKKALEMEKESMLELIKELQTKYFVKKIIAKETYETCITEYQKRVAEIEKIVKLLDESGGVLKK